MSRPDVPEGDMTPHEFSDDDADAIISGFAPSDPELGAALDDLRSAFASVEPPTASGALSEFIVHGAEPVPVTAAATAMVEPLVDPTPTRRHSMLASISAFAGTALGKLCIGASVATAAVGGATVAGVDTPVTDLFTDDSVVVTEPDDDIDVPVIDDPAGDELGEPDSDSSDSDDDADFENSNDDDSDDDSDSDSDSDSDDDDSDDDSDSDDSDSDSDDSDDSPTSTTVPGGSAASVTHGVPGVGSVTFTYDSGNWVLIAATPTGDWVVDEASIDGEGIDVTFINGVVEVDVDTEIEDGQIRLRVRTEDETTDERTEAFFWYPLS